MFLCIENGEVISVLPYKPNVPSSVEVVEITDKEDAQIRENTHYFDVVSKTVKPVPTAELEKQQAEKDNIQFTHFLSSTDWKVLRHIRQKALGIPTSLTEEEYLALEADRQNAASNIKNV